MLKILALINNIEEYQKIHNHVWRKHQSRIYTEKIDDTRNYLIEEINSNELMSKNHKMVCTALTYMEHFLFIVSKITGFVSISDCASLVDIPIAITSSAIALTTCAIIARFKKYKPIIKKKKTNHD